MLVLWKARIKEFSFCAKREPENSRFVEKENPTIRGKRESEKFRFVENQNSLFVKNENPRNLNLWKTRILEISFCGKRDSLNSRFVENKNPRICGKRESVILVLWKTRILIFFGKCESVNCRFV